ncbi:MAG: DNA repair protein RecO, partial [Mesorhizobium sp.]
RDAHGGLYEALAVMISHLGDADAAGELVARFELLILDELGFGLDLSQCAATGSRQDLAYVSPKSGRAVSRAAGAAWHDKMLALPAFLQRGTGVRADAAALEDAFRLTGFFFT